MIKRCIQAGLVGALLAMSFFIPLPESVSVERAAVGTFPFGGKITYTTVCTCSAPNWGIKVGPPMGGDFIYTPGTSRLYAFYSIFRPGPWALGTAQGYAPCMQYRGNSCVPDEVVPGGPVMVMVGTSL